MKLLENQMIYKTEYSEKILQNMHQKKQEVKNSL